MLSVKFLILFRLSVRFPLQSSQQVISTPPREFYPHPVAVLYVGSEGFTDFTDLAGQDQLIAVIHEVKVGADAEAGVSETVAGFIIVERLVLWAFVSAGFGEVVAVRFAVGYRERDESVVATLLEVNARFGVEEVPVLVDIHVVAGFVVAAFDRVVDTPVLLSR